MRLTIYDIKRLSTEKSPYFFSHNTMKFFGQRMSDFSVHKQKDGKYLITAPMRNPKGEYMGSTVRLFNPKTNELETLPLAEEEKIEKEGLHS